MIMFSDNELIALLKQDVPFLDNTSFGLGILGFASVNFYPKNDEIVLCGLDECVRLAKLKALKVRFLQKIDRKLSQKACF